MPLSVTVTAAAGLACTDIRIGECVVHQTKLDVSAFTSLRETWASVWQLADGHLWLLALIGTGAALVLVRVLIAEHLLSFQNGAVQGGAADGQS